MYIAPVSVDVLLVMVLSLRPHQVPRKTGSDTAETWRNHRTPLYLSLSQKHRSSVIEVGVVDL